MRTLLISLFILFGITLNTHASASNQNEKAMSTATIKKMDRQMNKHKARSRNFKTPQEFKTKQHKHVRKSNKKSMNYKNGYNYTNDYYTEDYRPIRQRGYRHSKRGWILAYQYDRASFYDNEGYFYGYFNRHGYYFEDIFYRYDRYYTYRDRVRGRGLFSRHYYMPANASYYGFCDTHYPNRDYVRPYERGYDRY